MPRRRRVMYVPAKPIVRFYANEQILYEVGVRDFLLIFRNLAPEGSEWVYVYHINRRRSSTFANNIITYLSYYTHSKRQSLQWARYLFSVRITLSPYSDDGRQVQQPSSVKNYRTNIARISRLKICIQILALISARTKKLYTTKVYLCSITVIFKFFFFFCEFKLNKVNFKLED